MQRATIMVMMLPVSSGPSGVRRVRISLPLIEPLLDNSRYYLPDNLPPAAGQDLRGLSRPKVHKVVQQQRRGALWTCHDRGGPDRRRQPRDEAEPVNPARASGQPDQQRDLVRLAERREQRDLAELARVLGDPC